MRGLSHPITGNHTAPPFRPQSEKPNAPPPEKKFPSGGDPDERLIDAKEFYERLNVSKATFYREKEKESFPPARRIGSRGVRWLLSEVIAWLRAGMPDQATWLEIRGTFGFGIQGAK